MCGLLPPEALGEGGTIVSKIVILSLPASGGPRSSSAREGTTPVSTSVFTGLLPVRVSFSFCLLTDHLSLNLVPMLNPE